ncbi:hypothetical protein L873DRAFT_1921235 [Choiromyces venosus 120613-1]|uniref:Uncharacterized protein n=1 Tax=Choiromyces venosus 120613-1 TaxID=1336337 RepID=A0A3N4JFN5_9PEZI|nr:hypothetical protein L873DRAFT_1921235 [Choiromyces venosus 120613-1]
MTTDTTLDFLLKKCETTSDTDIHLLIKKIWKHFGLTIQKNYYLQHLYGVIPYTANDLLFKRFAVTTDTTNDLVFKSFTIQNICNYYYTTTDLLFTMCEPATDLLLKQCVVTSDTTTILIFNKCSVSIDSSPDLLFKKCQTTTDTTTDLIFKKC